MGLHGGLTFKGTPFHPPLNLPLPSLAGVLHANLTPRWCRSNRETYEYRQPRLSSSKEFTLYLLRGSDPPVDLARFIIASPSSSSSSSTARTSEIALQQYNMDRFDLKDPKGLEVLIVLGFLTFAHAYDERAGGGGKAESRRQAGGLTEGSKTTSLSPALPPKDGNDGEDTLTGWQDYEDPVRSLLLNVQSIGKSHAHRTDPRPSRSPSHVALSRTSQTPTKSASHTLPSPS